MKVIKLVFDSVNARIVTENDEHVLYTDVLECPDSVVENVVNSNNSFVDKTMSEKMWDDHFYKIDNYLMDEVLCTQEDREIILEGVFRSYIKK